MATPPSAPIIRHAPKASPNTLEYFWYPPANQGSSAVTGYRLTLQPGNLVYTFGLTDYYMVTGLTNGQTYQTTIEATNDNGSSYGPPASFREFQPGFPPTVAPSTVTATMVNPSTALVSWTPPTVLPTAQIFWYVVRSQSTNPSDPVLSTNGFALTQSAVFVPGLNSNSLYTFQVRPVNCPGYGPTGITNAVRWTEFFTPSQITGQVQWLDASSSDTFSLSAGTSTITQWRDISLYANNTCNVAGSPAFITGSLNGLGGVAFNGSPTQLVVPRVIDSNWSLFIVLRTSQASSAGSQWHNGNGVYDMEVAGITTDFGTSIMQGKWATGIGSTDTTVSSVTTVNTGNGFIVDFLRVSATGAMSNYVNGNLEGQTTGPTGSRTAASRITIGSLQTNVGYYNGFIHEIIAYSNVITPFDRQKVEGYLAWKWGLQSTLSTIHPFRNSRPNSNSVFTPTMIPGIQMWLDGADPLATGTAPTSATFVPTWFDKSGSGNNGTIPSGRLPIYEPASSSIYFSSLSANYSTNVSASLANESIFYVFKADFSVAGIPGFGTSGTSGGRTLGGGNTTNSFGSSKFNVGWGSVTATNTVTTNTITLGEYVNLNNTNIVYLNGGSSTGSPVSLTYDAGLRTHIYGGSNNNIYEILNYNRALSSDERQTVEGYLAWRWGIQNSLPSTHPYRFTNPSQVITPFSPTQVTNLQLWLDAADTTTFTLSNVSTITRWRDKSGNGFHYGTSQNAVILSNDGTRQVTAYNGNSDLALSTTTTFNTTNTSIVFAVAKIIPATSIRTLWGYSSDFTVRYGNTTENALSGGPGIGGANAQDWSGSYFVNGSQNTTNVSTYTTYHTLDGVAGTNVNSAVMRVGGLGNNNRQLSGTIGEILVYTSISADDRQRVQGYLAWKWGLQNTLPYVHPYKSLNPLNSATTVLSPNGLNMQLDANVYNGGPWFNTGSSGQTNNASPFGGAPSKNTAGNGIVFNGSLYYTFPNVFNATGLTLSAWYKRTTTTIAVGDSAILAQQFTSGRTTTMCFGVGGSATSNVQFARFSSSWISSVQTVGTTIGQWVHIVMSYNNSIVTTYSNGVSLGSTNVGTLENSGGLWFIGRNWASTNPMNGELGQVLVYTRALNPEEVVRNYVATSNVYSV